MLNITIFGIQSFNCLRMKKLYFSLFTLLVAMGSAQNPLLTFANHAPVVGDSYTRTQVDSTGAAALATITGSTSVWTFTTPITRTVTAGWYNAVNTYSPGTAANTSTALTYPAASIAKVNTSDKSFYTTSSSGLEFWGGKITIATVAADFLLSTGVTHAVYPMVFGGSATTPAFTGTITSFVMGSISNGSAVVTYDGVGVLNLPGRSFGNVVRLKTRTYFDYVAGVTGSVTFDNYDYYSLSNSKHPIFSVAASTITSSFGPPSIQFFAYVNADYLAISVEEVSKEVSAFKVFPNPAQSDFKISFINENNLPASYEIINALGQTIKTEKLNSQKGKSEYYIETEGLHSGIYFVKTTVGTKSSVKKLTINN